MQLEQAEEERDRRPRPQSRIRRIALSCRGGVGLAVRACVMAVPLAWLAARVDVGAVAGHVRRLGWAFFLAAWIVYLSSLVPSAVRWRLLLGAFGGTTRPSLLALWRINVESAWYNLLPTGLFGDVLRGHRLRGAVTEPAVSYVVAFGERIVGLVGLAGFAVAAMAIDRGPGRVAVPPAVDLGVAVAFLLPVGVFGLMWLTRGWLGARSLPPGRAERYLSRILNPRAIPALFVALLLSVAVQVIVVASLWILARRLSPAATPLACARLFPPALLALFLPLTPGGFGQREAVFVFLFAVIGMDADRAVALSVGCFSVGLATGLLGGVFLLARSVRAHRDRDASARLDAPPR